MELSTTIETLVGNFGYPGLFLAAFLGATLVPLSSEIAMATMLGFNFNMWFVFGVATVGNVTGSLFNYYLGLWGADFSTSRFFKIDKVKMAKARDWYKKWGPPTLFWTWVPGVGDFLPIIAGMLKANVWVCSGWLFLGKSIRYLLILGAMYSVI